LEQVDNYDLGKEDRKYLEAREKTIEAGRATFLEVGRALIESRFTRNGKARHPSSRFRIFP